MYELGQGVQVCYTHCVDVAHSAVGTFTVVPEERVPYHRKTCILAQIRQNAQGPTQDWTCAERCVAAPADLVPSECIRESGLHVLQPEGLATVRLAFKPRYAGSSDRRWERRVCRHTSRDGCDGHDGDNDAGADGKKIMPLMMVMVREFVLVVETAR